ncbi:MAG: UDP-N-acetylglucosamine--N-acetylmuramyl-(pentapeptide) pyrophosphoryl-undecaprenol N-acetylglucosamine transferase, partial [Vulcanimicrobiaceae bacterium]
YVCAPVVAAASLLRTVRLIDPVIALLEPNAKPGLTNRVLAPLVDEVWCAPWTTSVGGRPSVVTGIPVRPQFKALPPKPRARESLSIDTQATVVAVFGGSQGSRSINEAVLAMLTAHDLPHEWWILHISGRRDAAIMDAGLLSIKRAGNRFTLLPYLDDLWTAYAAADLVIARAGASTLGELAVTGRPAILVPYPFAADDHQTANAQAFSESGAAKVLADNALSGDNLFRALSNALESQTLASMAKAAASLAPADASAMIVRRVHALRDERKQT